MKMKSLIIVFLCIWMMKNKMICRSLFLACVFLSIPVDSISAQEQWTNILEERWIHDIVNTDDGVTWVACGTLMSVANENITVHLPSTINSCKAVTTDGSTIWASSGTYVMKYDGDTWEKILDTSDDGYYSITALEVDVSGNIWASVEFFGLLLKYDGDTWTYYTLPDSETLQNYILSLAVDNDGGVWAGTFNNGLYHFDGANWTHYSTNDGLLDNTVRALLWDKSGIWCGTAKGLSILSGTSWTSYTTADGLIHENVTDLAFGTNGDLWISAGSYGGYADRTPCEYDTYGGVSHFANGVWIQYNEENGLSKNYVESIAVSHDGKVWCGSLCGCSILSQSAVTVDHSYPDCAATVIVKGNFPNPANPVTTMSFVIAHDAILDISIRNMLGQRIKTLSHKRYSPGCYNMLWDATDNYGNPVSSGIYMCVFKVGLYRETHKVTIVR